MVALAEVADGDGSEDEDESYAEEPESIAAEGGVKAAEQSSGDYGRGCGEEGYGELEGDGEGKVEEAGGLDDERGEPDGEWRVGLEDGWAVGVEVRCHALGGEEEPELIVAGVCEEGEEG